VAPYEAVNLKELMKPYADLVRDDAFRRPIKARLGNSLLARAVIHEYLPQPPPAVAVPWETKAGPSQRAPWWEAPYADWDPGPMPEDFIVDPAHV
jgi:hypothetical protein